MQLPILDRDHLITLVTGFTWTDPVEEAMERALDALTPEQRARLVEVRRCKG
jgi:hypothetical protein